MYSASQRPYWLNILVFLVFCRVIVAPAIDADRFVTSSPDQQPSPPNLTTPPSPPPQSSSTPAPVFSRSDSFILCSQLDLRDEKFQQLAKNIKGYVCRKTSHLDTTILECIQSGNAQRLVDLSKCSICLSRIPSTEVVSNCYLNLKTARRIFDTVY